MKKMVFLFAASCLFSLPFCKAWGQADSSAIDNLSLKDLLNVKVVTASKISQGLAMAPATVIVVTREQIRMRGYQSLLDVMYDLPDVKVDDKMYGGIRNTFTVRGTQGSEKFIILLDGVNINSPSGEALPVMENYPVNLAEQIEVVFGPASALYGANAVSGVINIITRKASSKDLNLDVSSVGGSYGYTNSSLYLSKKLDENSRLVFSAQYSYDKGVDYSRYYKNDPQLSVASYASGTIPSIFGPMTPVQKLRAKYEAPMQGWNIYAAFQSSRFNLSFFRNSAMTPGGFGTNTSNSIFNKEVSMSENVTTAVANYKKAYKNITSTSALIVSQYNLNPRSNFRNLYTAMESAYKYSTTTMFRFEEQADYNPSKKMSVSTGISYENYSSVPQSADLDRVVDRNNYLQASYLGTSGYYRPGGLPAHFYFIKYYNAGSYLQMQYSPDDKLHFTLGARYDYNSRYGTTFNPRLGVVYSPSANTTAKLLYGRSFLAPLPYDTYAQWGSFTTADSGRTYTSTFLHLPNPHLAPITSNNIELNINQKLSDNLFLTLDGYYTFIKGLHVFSNDNATTHLYNNLFYGIPVDYIEVFTNNNRQKTCGGSLRLNWKYNHNRFHFTSYASMSYVGGVVEQGLTERIETDSDRQLDFISPFIFHLGTDAKIGRFSFAPRLIVMGRQYIAGLDGTTSGGVIKRQTLPGYALLNASLRYNASKKFSVYMNVSNALNQYYRAVSFRMDLKNANTELMNGQPQDPIRFTGGINFAF